MMMSNMGEAGGGGCECVSWVWMCHTGFNTAPWFCILYPFSPQDFICLPFWSSCSVSLLWCAALLLFLTPLWFCSRGWIKWPCIGCWGLRMLPRAVFSFFSVPAQLLLISPVPLENCSVFSQIIPYSLRTLVQLIFWLIRHIEWVFASARVLPASVCAFQHKSTEMHFSTSHEWIVKGHYCHWKLFWAKNILI